ncbi:polysaccharide deacetylase family protein [Micromonosporaceae bacterium Da 78-11]
MAGPTWFSAARTDDMIRHLLAAGAAGAATSGTAASRTVVDSTNGILDGRMMAAGLDVYRADPHLLPERPDLGSVPAEVLAGLGWRDPGALTRLEPTRGTQTGRESMLQDDARASAAALAAMVDAHRCVAHGDRDKPEITLTFDDGPLPEYTGQVLDILRRYRIPATFFCVGMNATAHPEMLQRMQDEGHTIGNHTWSHPFLPELSHRQLLEQLDRTNEAITKATGVTPRLFRPPYGSRTPEVLDWLGAVDTTMVLWDVEPDDWSMPGTSVITRRVVDRTRNGSVILLHDGGGNRSQMVEALPRIIEELEQSYRFVPAGVLVNEGK